MDQHFETFHRSKMIAFGRSMAGYPRAGRGRSSKARWQPFLRVERPLEV